MKALYGATAATRTENAENTEQESGQKSDDYKPQPAPKSASAPAPTQEQPNVLAGIIERHERISNRIRHK